MAICSRTSPVWRALGRTPQDLSVEGPMTRRGSKSCHARRAVCAAYRHSVGRHRDADVARSGRRRAASQVVAARALRGTPSASEHRVAPRPSSDQRFALPAARGVVAPRRARRVHARWRRVDPSALAGAAGVRCAHEPDRPGVGPLRELAPHGGGRGLRSRAAGHRVGISGHAQRAPGNRPPVQPVHRRVVDPGSPLPVSGRSAPGSWSRPTTGRPRPAGCSCRPLSSPSR